MESTMRRIYSLLFIIGLVTSAAWAQPETPVEEWTDKTILLVGAHPDDGSGAYGTLSMLRENGNEVYVLLMTTGNVGTKDSTMTRDRLAKIRRQEELGALEELGIPEENYINLGYNDGMLEFADREEVVRRLVKKYRELKPDVLFAFDPGYGNQKWLKADHRSAGYLAADAARAAEWRLLFPGQIIHDGLEKHWIQEYMFFSGNDEDQNTWIDISDYAEQKVDAVLNHVSQFSSAWNNYTEELNSEDRKEFIEKMEDRVYSNEKDGKTVEGFRYYRGVPDGIGHRR